VSAMMNGKKRGERTNAKSVEVLDQEGKVILDIV
jgi:hypothetical protein